MENLFLTILNISITASWLVLAVIVLRLLLRKVPKSLVVVMWALVGIRLICPFSVESGLSLIPSAQVIPDDILILNEPSEENDKEPSVGMDETPDMEADAAMGTGNSVAPEHSSGENAGQTIHTNSVPGVEEDAEMEIHENDTDEVTVMKKIVSTFSVIWVLGIITMFAYGGITYLRLRQKVSVSLLSYKNIYLCDDIDTPFILGIFKPHIYLPSGMEDKQMTYVIKHEQAHLQRKDHWWKPFGLVLLAIHWFNPVM